MRLPSTAKDELGLPDACLMFFFDQVIAFDHVKKEIHLIVTADLTRAAAREKAKAAKEAARTEKAAVSVSANASAATAQKVAAKRKSLRAIP